MAPSATATRPNSLKSGVGCQEVLFFAVQPAWEERCVTNILVVDDSATMRRMIIASLQTLSGAKFHQAGNGLEAIEVLALQPIDLLFLDMNMPDMHGLELLEFLHSHPLYNRLPVIVLTTRGDDQSRSAALAAGATRYMTKPFTPQGLTQAAKEVLASHSLRPAMSERM